MECEFGVVKIVRAGNKVYVIYSPDFTETAKEIMEMLGNEGYPIEKIIPLNTGIEYEAELAEELLAKCP